MVASDNRLGDARVHIRTLLWATFAGTVLGRLAAHFGHGEGPKMDLCCAGSVSADLGHVFAGAETFAHSTTNLGGSLLVLGVALIAGLVFETPGAKLGSKFRARKDRLH